MGMAPIRMRLWSTATRRSGSVGEGKREGNAKRRISVLAEQKPQWIITRATAKGKRSSCMRYLLKAIRHAEQPMYRPPRKSMRQNRAYPCGWLWLSALATAPAIVPGEGACTRPLAEQPSYIQVARN